VSDERTAGPGGAGDDRDPSTGSGDGDESLLLPRVTGVASLELTPHRREVRRLAQAMRDIIASLVSTTASTEDLASAADDLENLAAVLGALPSGQTYQGFAEAANAGQLPMESEAWEFFDYSPFIGLANPMSPPMRMEHVGDRIVCDVTFGPAYEGPPGCVHGGYVAGAFDELLGAAQSLSGTQGMTAHLEVDYRRPTPLNTPLRMEAWLDRIEGRKIWTRGTIVAGGELRAEASGLFIAFQPNRFQELLDARDE
jgi:acyl-coenzyme A thioesterase PaaI-like protein